MSPTSWSRPTHWSHPSAPKSSTCTSSTHPDAPHPYGGKVASARAGALSLGDVARDQIVEALAAHHHPRGAVAAEDHRRAGNAVVVGGHRVPVGPGHGRHDHIARVRVV